MFLDSFKVRLPRDGPAAPLAGGFLAANGAVVEKAADAMAVVCGMTGRDGLLRNLEMQRQHVWVAIVA